MKIDQTATYQTLETFGTSGCWWSQYMGLWDMPYGGGPQTVREKIAALLFDRETGIGLTGYRYNLGSGSADSGRGKYADVHRRAQNLEAEPGVYDWGKDKGAVWFLKRAVELGVKEVVLFCNSPLERLTENGTAQMIKGESRSNIAPQNYAAWAVYCCDVAEHFLETGIPVRFLSPINEPELDWYAGNQEGCHYEPAQAADVYKAFLAEMKKRPALSGVGLTGPESGKWSGRAEEYASAILDSPVLKAHFTGVDCHSYWSDAASKLAFVNWLKARSPDKKIRMSEWCEMVRGTDAGMDSAIVLAKTVAEDLAVMDAVSWCTWVGVSPGGFHDGLIHAAEDERGEVSLMPLKRLWAYGNYTRFIRPGFVRVEVSGGEDCGAVAFRGEEDGKQILAAVLINDGTAARPVKLEGDFRAFERVEVYETSAKRDLARVAECAGSTSFTLAPRSVTTIVFSARK